MSQVLDYQTPAKAVPAWPRWLRILFAVGVVPAAVTPWVPFVHDVGPLTVMVHFVEAFNNLFPIFCVALPFFLAVPMAAWNLRLAIRGTPRPWEHWTLCLIGVLCGIVPDVCILAHLFFVDQQFNAEAVGIVLHLVVIWAVVGVNVWLLRRWRRPAERITTAVLYGSYLANAALCLWAFYQERDVGWYVTLAACPLLVTEMVLGTWQRRPRVE